MALNLGPQVLSMALGGLTSHLPPNNFVTSFWRCCSMLSKKSAVTISWVDSGCYQQHLGPNQVLCKWRNNSKHARRAPDSILRMLWRATAPFHAVKANSPYDEAGSGKPLGSSLPLGFAVKPGPGIQARLPRSPIQPLVLRGLFPRRPPCV